MVTPPYFGYREYAKDSSIVEMIAGCALSMDDSNVLPVRGIASRNESFMRRISSGVIILAAESPGTDAVGKNSAKWYVKRT